MSNPQLEAALEEIELCLLCGSIADPLEVIQSSLSIVRRLRIEITPDFDNNDTGAIAQYQAEHQDIPEGFHLVDTPDGVILVKNSTD